MRASYSPRQHGLTLIEMMIALAIGLAVVLAAATLLQHARVLYQEIDDASRVQETGRLVLAHLGQALRQAGHQPWEALIGSKDRPVLASPVKGADDSRQAAEADPAQGRFVVPGGNGINKSDMLMLGFFGAPRGSGAYIGNCSGAAAAAGPFDERTRNWVIYYIATGSGNEPELRCRYQGKNGAWTSDALARGVEAMQVRYGVAALPGGRPERWMEASAMDEAAWQRVVLVRVALLVRGNQRRPAPAGAKARGYDLFVQNGRSDPAWHFTEKNGERRIRVVFQTTVLLRNAGVVDTTGATRP